jgi:phosphoglycolate phosphatase-like HAD superfamily hydrolase
VATGSRLLVLWDIDGTLLTLPGFGQRVYAAALRVVTGRDLDHLPDLAGQTDRHIAEALLDRHGHRLDETVLAAFYAAMADAAREHYGPLAAGGTALAGAREALLALAAEPGVVQSVVTGNVRPNAEHKLALFGLAGWIDFDIGGYGSDHSDRSVLVRRALDRAAAKYGRDMAPARTLVIGDTPRDVAGAKANGVPVAGVATGRSSVAELSRAGADPVWPSLMDTAAVLRAVRGLAEPAGGASLSA